MGKVRIGVIGVGYLGSLHAEKYAKMEHVELSGVVDVDEKRVKEVAQRCNTNYYTNSFYAQYRSLKNPSVPISLSFCLVSPRSKLTSQSSRST